MKKILKTMALLVMVIQTMTLTTEAAGNLGDQSDVVITEVFSTNEYPKMNVTYGTLSLTSDGISTANIYLSYDSNGLLAQFSTSMTKTASVVGVKDIKIYQDVWYGWKQVGTSSGGYDTNKAAYGCSLTYPGASVGQTFKASCVHYGIIDGVTYERPNETSGFTYVDPNN